MKNLYIISSPAKVAYGQALPATVFVSYWAEYATLDLRLSPPMARELAAELLAAAAAAEATPADAGHALKGFERAASAGGSVGGEHVVQGQDTTCREVSGGR